MSQPKTKALTLEAALYPKPLPSSQNAADKTTPAPALSEGRLLVMGHGINGSFVSADIPPNN